MRSTPASLTARYTEILIEIQDKIAKGTPLNKDSFQKAIALCDELESKENKDMMNDIRHKNLFDALVAHTKNEIAQASLSSLTPPEAKKQPNGTQLMMGFNRKLAELEITAGEDLTELRHAIDSKIYALDENISKIESAKRLAENIALDAARIKQQKEAKLAAPPPAPSKPVTEIPKAELKGYNATPLAISPTQTTTLHVASVTPQQEAKNFTGDAPRISIKPSDGSTPAATTRIWLTREGGERQIGDQRLETMGLILRLEKEKKGIEASVDHPPIMSVGGKWDQYALDHLVDYHLTRGLPLELENNVKIVTGKDFKGREEFVTHTVGPDGKSTWTPTPPTALSATNFIRDSIKPKMEGLKNLTSPPPETITKEYVIEKAKAEAAKAPARNAFIKNGLADFAKSPLAGLANSLQLGPEPFKVSMPKVSSTLTQAGAQVIPSAQVSPRSPSQTSSSPSISSPSSSMPSSPSSTASSVSAQMQGSPRGKIAGRPGDPGQRSVINAATATVSKPGGEVVAPKEEEGIKYKR